FGVAITGTDPPGPGPASRRPGNAGNGVAATRAAYRAGFTTTTPVLIELPDPASRLAASASPGATAYTASLCVTPGTAASARCAAGGTTCWDPVVRITASAPVSCQDAATWPRLTAARSVKPSATTARATTNARAGSSAAGLPRAALVMPRNPTGDRRGAVRAASPRSGSG